MKKSLLATITILLLCYNVKAQDYFKGLIGLSYSSVYNNGQETKNNSPLYIIYNEHYCQLYINGTINNFATDSYSKNIEGGDIAESFISSETATKPRGFYSINILHNKSGKSQITINMPLQPGGAAFFVRNASVYSENGHVLGKAHINNWRELEKQAKYDDSVKSSNKIVTNAIPTYNVQDFFNEKFIWSEQQSHEKYLGVIKCKLQIDSTGRVMFIKYNEGCELKDVHELQSSFLAKFQGFIRNMPNWMPAKKKNGSHAWTYENIEIKLIPTDN